MHTLFYFLNKTYKSEIQIYLSRYAAASKHVFYRLLLGVQLQDIYNMYSKEQFLKAFISNLYCALPLDCYLCILLGLLCFAVWCLCKRIVQSDVSLHIQFAFK